jgi:hypothetical protein
MKRVTLILLMVLGLSLIATAQTVCPDPFPAAQFYVEAQPNSPVQIRRFSAAHVLNPKEPGHYRTIRVTFYFENQSAKRIKHIIWDNPSPDENEYPSGGISAQGLFRGESERYEGIFHTQKGPAIVFRVTEVAFANGTKWEAGRYNKAKVLQRPPFCVVPEELPDTRPKRILRAGGWSTPIIADRVRKTITAETKLIDRVWVQTKIHEIDRERLALIEICPPDPFLGIDANRPYDFDVEKYESFAVDGRTFAYRINYEFVDEAGQYKTGAGTASLYVDQDGSGKFTLGCDGNVAPPIPKWIRELTPKKKQRRLH